MSSDDSTPRTGVSPAIIPLSVLCAGLVVGGIAAVFITRRIARARLLLELHLAAEAKAAEERLGVKPVLVDVYVGPSPVLARGEGLPWPGVQPIATKLREDVCSPHPHHTIENHPAYVRVPLVDGNVLQLSVGIAMPSQTANREAEGLPAEIVLESLEYCIGTSDVVVCSLLGARQRLIGIN